MATWEKIGLGALALGIPAIVAAALFAWNTGPDLDRAARECERAIRLDPPLPRGCPPPPKAGADAPPAEASAEAGARGSLPSYERQGGLRRRWPGGGTRTDVSRRAPQGRGPAPSAGPIRRALARPGGVYVVQEGDTFLGIVRRAYGSTDRWMDVWFANHDAFGDGASLAPGTELRLPE